MLDRSRAARALSAAFAVACLLAVPAAAEAAKEPGVRAVPAGAPTVATTASGAAIIAWADGGRTCTVLQAAGEPRPTRLTESGARSAEGEADGTCEPTPVLSRFHAELTGHLDDDTATVTLWGVAGPAAATIQARRGATVLGAGSAALAPVSAALPGPAGQLRFWAMDLPADRARIPDEFAVLDASGTVRRAWEADDFVGGINDEDPAASGPVLARGRAGAAAWTLRRTVERKLVPTPLEPERRVEVRCLSLTIRAAASRETGGSEQGGPCDDGTPLTVYSLAVDDSSSCGTGIAVAVLARAPVRAAVAVLGDGSRRRLALSAVGGATGARGGALLVPPGVAIRRVEGLGAGGKVVRTWRLAAAPVGRRCASSSSSGWTSYAGYAYATDARGPGPHVARAIDAGAQLCVAIGRAPRAPLDCRVPPVDPEEAFASAPDVPGGEYLYALVPVEVTAARVRFADGSTQTVPATPIPGYTGQYAATTAQIALDVAKPKALRSVVFLDAGGRVLGRSQPLGPFDSEAGPAKTLLPAAGSRPAVRVRPVTLTVPRSTITYTCVQVGTGLEPDDCTLSLIDATPGPDTVQVLAGCAPHQLIVLAALRRAADRLVIRTGGGREVVARSLQIPPGAGDAAGRYLAFAVLGPHERVTGLLVRGRAGRRISAEYPPAAEQCGYVGTPGGLFG